MRSALAPVASFVAVLALGQALLAGLGGAGGDPRAVAVDEAIAASSGDVLVLGNSVTQSAIDAPALGEALHLPAGAVAKLATEGAGPATWLASWDRAVRAGLHPRIVLLYVPLHMVWTPEDPHESDLALLADLGAPDAAWALTGHPAPDVVTTLQSRRFHLRETVLDGLTAGLADLLWQPSPSGKTASSRARAALFGAPRPNEHTGQGQRVDGGGAPVVAASAPRPEVAAALLDEARRTGARLVVVQAAANPEGHPRACGPTVALPELEASLKAGGADLLDLSTALDQERDFTTHHHLTPDGRAAATVLVARGIGELGALTGGGGEGRRWVAPCPSSVAPAR